MIARFPELIRAKELLSLQAGKYIDEICNEDPITSTSLEKLIAFLRDDIDKNDYLKRGNEAEPIEAVAEIPGIYKALHSIIEFTAQNS